ncbi:MAG: HAD family hydrolase [Parcubacteria group bacterium Gr01-1014_91]|nr:MAG: HAD family hydrolase [Parcubacteria group bacterium Gr01-1014_91]
MTKLIIFDLDGTLAESKQPLTAEMAEQVAKLLAKTRVAVISGGALSQFLKQVVSQLPVDANLSHLYILPTSGAALYEFQNDNWKKIYEERLSEKDKDVIEEAIITATKKTGLINFKDQSWGERIEYRGGQVTLSALGQHAPLKLKKMWDRDHAKRHALRDAIAELIPRYSVSIGGATSIDVTKKGIDKAYGIHQLCDRLGISESEALYVGDELESGGNDEAVYKTEVQTKSVASPFDTERLIKSLLTAS